MKYRIFLLIGLLSAFVWASWANVITEGRAYRDKFSHQSGVVNVRGILYKIERKGTGAYPKSTDTVTVNYEGKLINGKVFDSSYKRHKPTTFALNAVIPGWTIGLQKVRKGGKILLVIPPNMAYGSRAVGDAIPPNSTLIFTVELLKINGK